MERFSINRLLNEYALSCIENYLLYLISEQRTDWSLIFWESYLPFRQIMKLIEMGQDYSHFNGVRRLQSIAEQQGICKLKYLNSDSLPKEIIYNYVFAMQVKKNI